MATLRCPSSLVLRRILLAACVGCSVARADEPRQPAPRTIMRVPAWIESLGRPDAASRQQAGKEASPRPSRLETAPADTRVIPVVDASPAKPAQQTGGLKRWIADRVATLPKPAARPVADEPAAAPAEQETTPDSAREPAKQAPDSLVSAPVAATPDEMPTLSIDPASFRGVHPGKTSREELETAWGSGEAFTREDGVAGLWWKVEPFERVEVMIESDTVASIRIKLLEPVAVADLARQLEISELRTVSILDEQGVSIGEVYPERGVVLSVKPGTRAANAILIEPLDPESFVLRAEGEIENRSAFAVADLEYAIQLDPKHVRAHRLLLAMASDQGKWTQALRLAEAAAALDPADIWTQLKHASVLAALDRPDEAATVLAGVTARENNSPLVTAQAERLLGRIALTGKKPDFQGAVDHFAEAIRRASPLLVKRSPAVQSAAREVMLDAHLGTALAIARGTWQQKGRVIPKWISRSETVVKDFKGSDAERQVLELQLCRGVLAASAASLESVEPLPWVKRILELRDRMGDSIKDPWRRRQIDWEVGQGLSDALTAAQKRGDATDMLDNATLTAAYLERGAEHRELTAAERTSIGELMFRVGIMYSLQRGDHATAVTWFDRAVPLWEGEEEPVARAEAGRLGESYVSMAISYWQVDRREDALALSRHGVDLMVDAVGRRQIEERSLAVAYGNLSTMYAEEGDDEQSRKYAEMASRAEASGSTLR